jgi:putative ABC transport system permease protein
MGEGFRASKVKAQFRLQPLTAIHLRSRLQFEFGANGDILNIYIFAAIAVMILAIAAINFINLATARSAQRAREVGLRKTLGACRRDLIGQFLAESASSSLLALIAAFILATLALPLFQSISGLGIAPGLRQLGWLLPLSFGLALVVGLVAGSYPAFYLSGFQPVKTLKPGPADPRTGPGGALFRRFLVVGQFSLSIFMISGTWTIGQQIRYMKNKDLGFQKDQVLAIRTADEKILRSLDAVKSRIKEIPGVLSVSAATFVPGQGQTINPVVPEGFAENGTVGYREIEADADYVRTMGMEIVAGRDFSADLPSDSSQSILINETAVRKLGWNDPLGKTMKIATEELFQYSTKRVVGVVRDFHYSSLRNGLEPLYISNEMRSLRVLAVKIEAGQTARIVRELKTAWQTISPGQMLNFFFVDELFEAQYRSEERLNRLFSAFSLIAVVIACLGLFGLASYMAEQREKEVGIRKVLGATSREIVGLMCGGFLKLVGLAALVAWPSAYCAAHFWLRGFAYRTSIHPWTFVFSGLAALAVASLTVSWQALRAASANPVEALKYE